MRIPRFYCPIALETTQALLLPDEVFRHAIQVLRLQAGENLILFNGQGGEYLAELVEISKRSARVQIQSFNPAKRESNLDLTLVQAMIKPDKMDFALQKAVELGISAFQPLITQRSVARTDKEKIEKKLQHWQAVAISACEQSGRTCLPQIHIPVSLSHYLSQMDSGATQLILAPESTKPLQQLQANSNKIAVLIGPEGGFNEQELEQCLAQGLQGISLGERILRAETASTSVLAILQCLYGDLGLSSAST